MQGNFIVINHQRYFESLSPEERLALKLYKSSADLEGRPFAYEINRRLRSGTALDGAWLRNAQLLDSAINRYHTGESHQLFRATFVHELRLAGAASQFSDPGYPSCATSMEAVSGHFQSLGPAQPVLMLIECPATAQLAPMECDVSFAGGMEQELLLPRDSSFRILAKRTLSTSDWEFQCALMRYPTLYSELIELSVQLLLPTA